MPNVLSSVLRLLLKIFSSWHMNKLRLLPLHFLDLNVTTCPRLLVLLFAFCCVDVANTDSLLLVVDILSVLFNSLLQHHHAVQHLFNMLLVLLIHNLRGVRRCPRHDRLRGRRRPKDPCAKAEPSRPLPHARPIR